jgi:hypothetical protein
MLTHQQTTILENAWEILDKLRNCRDFNESHDLTVGDACAVLSNFLDWNYERDRQNNHQQSLPLAVNVASLESFNNL